MHQHPFQQAASVRHRQSELLRQAERSRQRRTLLRNPDRRPRRVR